MSVGVLGARGLLSGFLRRSQHIKKANGRTVSVPGKTMKIALSFDGQRKGGAYLVTTETVPHLMRVISRVSRATGTEVRIWQLHKRRGPINR